MKIWARVLSSFVALCWAGPALAAEGGTGAYQLGSRGAGSGVTPPPGVYLSDQVWSYRGDIEGRLPTVGGPIAAQATVNTLVNIPTLLWVTPVEVLGGRLGMSATVPYGRVWGKGTVGPFPLEDSITTFADPVVTSFLGWRFGSLHVQLGASGYMPWGDYHKGELANISKNRLALDVFTAASFIDPGTGIDVTNVLGITFNSENTATNYKTGNEIHWEWSVTKKWQTGISVGAIGYVYNQLTDDSGTGALLGGYRGRMAAVGGTVGYDFLEGKLPVSTRLRYYHEVEAKNRLKGDAGFLSVTFPIWVDTATPR
jgi:hypothetical protein